MIQTDRPATDPVPATVAAAPAAGAPMAQPTAGPVLQQPGGASIYTRAQDGQRRAIPQQTLQPPGPRAPQVSHQQPGAHDYTMPNRAFVPPTRADREASRLARVSEPGYAPRSNRPMSYADRQAGAADQAQMSVFHAAVNKANARPNGDGTVGQPVPNADGSWGAAPSVPAANGAAPGAPAGPDYEKQAWRYWTAPGKMTPEQYRERAVAKGWLNADGTPVGGADGLKANGLAMLQDARTQGLNYQHLDKALGQDPGSTLHWAFQNLPSDQLMAYLQSGQKR